MRQKKPHQFSSSMFYVAICAIFSSTTLEWTWLRILYIWSLIQENLLAFSAITITTSLPSTQTFFIILESFIFSSHFASFQLVFSNSNNQTDPSSLYLNFWKKFLDININESHVVWKVSVISNFIQIRHYILILDKNLTVNKNHFIMNYVKYHNNLNWSCKSCIFLSLPFDWDLHYSDNYDQSVSALCQNLFGPKVKRKISFNGFSIQIKIFFEEKSYFVLHHWAGLGRR